MNPKLMVKKGGKCPPGDINTWFFEGNGLKDHVHKKLPSATASKMQVGTPSFGRFPENLLISRRRFGKAFQVPLSLCVLMADFAAHWIHLAQCASLVEVQNLLRVFALCFVVCCPAYVPQQLWHVDRHMHMHKQCCLCQCHPLGAVSGGWEGSQAAIDV